MEMKDDESDEPKIQAETREVGSVDGMVYWDYIKAGAGSTLFLIILLSTITSQAMFHGSDLFLSLW